MWYVIWVRIILVKVNQSLTGIIRTYILTYLPATLSIFKKNVFINHDIPGRYYAVIYCEESQPNWQFLERKFEKTAK